VTNAIIETSLDVQWAHAIAPRANILLVNAATLDGDQLFGAEVDGLPFESAMHYALRQPGVVVVSNSYGGSEFDGETDYDVAFASPDKAVTFSTGDFGAPGQYPSMSPNVVAVGGTSLNTITARGAYGTEAGWAGSGGSPSLFEPSVAFQTNNGVNFGSRSVPDVSMDGDPNTGVLVVDQFDGGPGAIFLVGGTSLSSPMWAGVIALGQQQRIANTLPTLNSQEVNQVLYSTYNSPAYKTDFHDITTGNNGFAAGPGYDLVTGIGSPKVQNIVPLLGSANVAPISESAVVGGPMSLAVHSAIGSHARQTEGAPIAIADAAASTTVAATSPSTPVAAGSVAFAVNVPQATTAANHTFTAQVMLSSGGGAATVTDTAGVGAVDTATDPVPTDAGLFTAPTAGVAGEAARAMPAAAPATPAGAAVVAVNDVVFANYGPVDAEADAVTSLVPSVAAREETTADLTGLAGMALALSGVWTYITPKQADILPAPLTEESRKRVTK
jgi:hypothetical protein